MRKRILLATVLGVAVLVTGGIFASNMGFKLNLSLLGPAAGTTGTQLIAIPFNQQTSLANAEDLLNDISACPGNALLVSRFVKSLDALSFYGCSGGDNFPLVKSEAYYVQVAANQSYIVVGSHDPSASVGLIGPAGGTTGTNSYSAPYHSVATTAEELINEISPCPGSTVDLVSRFVKSSDALSFYGCSGGDNFPLVAGEGYLIQVSSDISFVPAHY